MFIPTENTAGDGLLGMLSHGFDVWGAVKTAEAQSKADVYTRTPQYGSSIYGAGEPHGVTVGQAAAVAGSPLLVVAALGALALVAVLLLK